MRLVRMLSEQSTTFTHIYRAKFSTQVHHQHNSTGTNKQIAFLIFDFDIESCSIWSIDAEIHVLLALLL